MSAYFARPFSWALSQGYKAAWNIAVASHTCNFVSPEVAEQVHLKSAEILASLQLRDASQISGSVTLCLFAKVLGDAGQLGILQSDAGKLYQVYWHSVKNIRDACEEITTDDRASVVRYIAKTYGATVSVSLE